METNDFAGIWTALLTPFHEDGSLHGEAWDELLQIQDQGKVQGVVVGGTTGESPTLSLQERLTLLKRAKAAGHSYFLVAGCGGNDTRKAREEASLLVQAGAEALMVVTPYYSRPSLQGLREHYRCLKNEVEVPLILYHVPHRTGLSLKYEDMEALSPYVACIKECSGNMDLFGQITSKMRSHVCLTGNDSQALAAWAMGGQGMISVLSNVLPGVMVRWYENWLSGNRENFQKIFYILQPLLEVLSCESNPGPIKTLWAHWFGHGSHLRAPLAPVTLENQGKIIAVADEIKTRLELEGWL